MWYILWQYIYDPFKVQLSIYLSIYPSIYISISICIYIYIHTYIPAMNEIGPEKKGSEAMSSQGARQASVAYLLCVRWLVPQGVSYEPVWLMSKVNSKQLRGGTTGICSCSAGQGLLCSVRSSVIQGQSGLAATSRSRCHPRLSAEPVLPTLRRCCKSL